MHLLPDGASSLLCFTSVMFSSVIHCGSGYKLRENYGLTGMSELGPSGARHKGLMNRVLYFSQPASQNSGFSWFCQDFIDTRVKQLTGAIHAVPLPLFLPLYAICTIHTLLAIGTVALPSQPGAWQQTICQLLCPQGQASVPISVYILLEGQMKMYQQRPSEQAKKTIRVLQTPAGIFPQVRRKTMCIVHPRKTHSFLPPFPAF